MSGLPIVRGGPWTALILIWAAGAGVFSLGLTPKGVGVVEAILVDGLTTAGTPAGPALAGVLIRRIVRLWRILGVGATILGVLDLRRRSRAGRPHHRAGEPWTMGHR